MAMDNQRRSFRLDVEVGFEARLVSEEALQRGIIELKQRPNWNATLPSALNEIDIALQSLLEELGRTAPKAAGAIGLLNQKVDLLRLGQHWDDELRQLPQHWINLSATGLAYQHDAEIDRGQAVHCTLTLPSIAWSMQLYARVVSSRAEGDGYRICTDFEYIRDEDSEQLIRFNLLQQQQQLAREKLRAD